MRRLYCLTKKWKSWLCTCCLCQLVSLHLVLESPKCRNLDCTADLCQSFTQSSLICTSVEDGVLVSCSYDNKWPQIWWLTTIDIYSLTVLEARNLKSVVLLGWNGSVTGQCSLQMLSGGISPCLLQLLVADCIAWLVDTSLPSSRPASSNLSLPCLHTPSPLCA